jgi:hypothetical protein
VEEEHEIEGSEVGWAGRISESVFRKIARENAVRLFGL